MRLRLLGCMAVLVASLLAAPLSTAGAANRCKLLMLPPLPVRMEGLRPVIAADIDGVEAQFIVDTGSFFDFLSPAAAAHLKLPLQHAPPWYWVSGVGGSVVPRIATAKTFAVAGLTASNAVFLVGNNDFRDGVAGVLGQNLFRIADVDFDFANGVLRFVKPQHCGDAVLAYWATTQSIGEVDLHWTSRQRPALMAKASVNGHDIEVLFDTGTPRTVLSLAAARRAGITRDSPGVAPAGSMSGVGSHTIKVWSAPVARFEIGGEAIEHTRLLIGDIGVSGLGADMLLGSDFFLAHHIYVANSQNKLYFTYNGGPVFDLNAHRPLQAASAAPAGKAEQPGATSRGGNPSAPSAAAGGGPAPHEPMDAAGLMRRGMAESSRGELSLAIADLTRACGLAPADANCPYQRGLAYWRNHDPRLALVDFNDAQKLAPGDYRAHHARAELQLPRLHAGVEGDLAAVDRLAPQEADLRLQLARLYGFIGKYSAAAHQLDLWIRWHPRDTRLSRALGLRCWARAAGDMDLDGALSDCNRATRVRLAESHSVFWRLTHRAAPGPGWLESNRSLVYLRLGDLARAIADDDAALRQIPSKESAARAYPLYLRGLAELRQGLKSRGEADLAAARKLRPGIDDYYASMGLEP